MPICNRCGERNPDSATACQKCGIPLGSQLRAQAGAARQRTFQTVRIVAWVVVLVVLAILAPGGYHLANRAFQDYHIKAVTAAAEKGCDGPATESMAAYQRQQIEDCMAKNDDLKKAQSDYDAFMKSEKK